MIVMVMVLVSVMMLPANHLPLKKTNWIMFHDLDSKRSTFKKNCPILKPCRF